MGVVTGIDLHFFRERPARPVGFLRAFVEFHAEKFFHEIAQAELRFAQQPCGEHGVENGQRREFMMLPQQPQIVVGGMKNHLVRVERGEERIKVDWRERVHQFVAGDGADLDEADLFGIRVEAVGLGVEGEPGSLLNDRQERRQFYVGINHFRQCAGTTGV